MQKFQFVPNIDGSRNIPIDFIRGIAVFFVLWGHAIQYSCAGYFDFFDNIAFKAIYSFHMPLFMLISGYLFWFSFEKRTFCDLIKHKTQQLLHPIIVCGIICFYLTDGINYVLSHEWKNLISGHWLDTLSGYWFLWSVLGASIVVSISFGKVRNVILRVIVIILGFGFVALFPNSSHNIFMYPYFIIGFVIGKYRNYNWIQKIYKFRYLSVPIYALMLVFFKKEHLIYISGVMNVGIDLFRWVIGLMGSISIISICYDVLFVYTQKSGKLGIIPSIICQVGKYSLHIYILQRIFLEFYYRLAYETIVDFIGNNYLANIMPIYNFLYSPLVAIICACFLLALIILLKTIKIDKLLFGK